jgi:hypothetical protein
VVSLKSHFRKVVPIMTDSDEATVTVVVIVGDDVPTPDQYTPEPDAMLGISGTTGGGERVRFKASGRFVLEVQANGRAEIDLPRYSILKPGEE